MDTKQVKQVINALPDSTDKYQLELTLAQTLFQVSGKKSMRAMAAVAQQYQSEIESQNQKKHQALEDAMHAFSMVSQALEENRTSHKAKNMVKYWLSSEQSPLLINVMKVYFPDATPKGASNAGQWLFNQFKQRLLEDDKYKDYLPGGKDYEWARKRNINTYIEKLCQHNQQALEAQAS